MANSRVETPGPSAYKPVLNAISGNAAAAGQVTEATTKKLLLALNHKSGKSGSSKKDYFFKGDLEAQKKIFELDLASTDHSSVDPRGGRWAGTKNSSIEEFFDLLPVGKSSM